MTYKNIIKFVNRAYKSNIPVFIGYDILEYFNLYDDFSEFDDEDEKWCATIPLISENKEIIFIIIIGEEFYRKNKNKESLFKFVLLHEIGHVKTYYDGVFDSDYDLAMWELKSQLYAIDKAKKMNLRYVYKKAIKNFEQWNNMDDPYKKAKEIYLKGLKNENSIY